MSVKVRSTVEICQSPEDGGGEAGNVLDMAGTTHIGRHGRAAATVATFYV